MKAPAARMVAKAQRGHGASKKVGGLKPPPLSRRVPAPAPDRRSGVLAPGIGPPASNTP
jgi:hypothetical protein